MTSSRFTAWGLVAARVFMGAFFLYEASGQFARGWIGGDGLSRMLTSSLRDNSLPAPYRSFLENVVLEHDALFTAIVIAGEIAVGVALLLGLATRSTVAGALFMNVNFALINGVITAGGLFDVLFIVGELALLAFAARQALSVDGMLASWGIASAWLSGMKTPDGPPRALEPRGQSAQAL